MGQIAVPNDGWKLLLALGIGPERRVRSATISIRPQQPVLLTIEEFVQPYNMIGDEVETLMSEYELRKVEK